MAGITRGGAWAGRGVASCVLGEGANELAEASIVATTRVRIIMAVIRAYRLQRCKLMATRPARRS